ncbi:hypothetical protein B9Z55_007407 [Caenorhabditis nigoni]|nr:hypothetical protein B9Z55_007407 [Caenorhabditis nigoni]
MGVGIHTFELTRNEIWMPTTSRVVLIEPCSPGQTANSHPNAPESCHILIAFSNKTIQFRKNLEDAPITTVFCDFPVSFARWSPDGSIVAVGGNHKKINFFSSQGKKLGELKGTSDHRRLDLTWDSSGNFIFCLGALLGCSLQSLAISKVTPVFEEVERREGETERDMLLP